VVSRAQLIELGLSARAIGHRIECGRLHPIHRGVYAVGHLAVSLRGRWMAAVLAGGEEAVLSHRSAAALWGMRRWGGGRVEVTVPRSHGRSRRGIQWHRGALPADEITVEDGIPVTTVPRTIFDLAGVRPRREVERAIEEAEFRRLTDPLSLHDLLARYPRRRGSRTIREILAVGRIGEGITRSDLEELFVAFVERTGLPRPQFNVPLEVGGLFVEPDCLWRRERVIVELDSRRAHATAAAFESDRARDRRLQAAGWHVVRVTWRQLHDQPAAIAEDLRRLLATDRDAVMRGR
jgi:very-short-patch-repair endonuclease